MPTDKTVMGTDGKVNVGASQVAGVTKWTLDKSAHVSQWASSDTGGYQASKAGVKSCKGSIEFKYDITAASPLLEGSQVTLQLYVDGTHYYNVPATIGEFTGLVVDIDTGEVVGATASYVGNGKYDEPTFS